MLHAYYLFLLLVNLSISTDRGRIDADETTQTQSTDVNDAKPVNNDHYRTKRGLKPHMNFPLWVRINGPEKLSADTEYKRIGYNIYKIMLPYSVYVEETNVQRNVSAVQQRELFPFWVQVGGNEDEDEEEGSSDVMKTAIVTFPLVIEVNSLVVVGGGGTTPTLRGYLNPVTEITTAKIMGGIVLSHLFPHVSNPHIEKAVKMLTEDKSRHKNVVNGTEKHTGSNLISFGKSIWGKAVGFVPYVAEAILDRIKNESKGFGIAMVSILSHVFKLKLKGEVQTSTSVIYGVLSHLLPFVEKVKILNNKTEPGWTSESNGKRVGYLIPPVVFPPPSEPLPGSLKIIIFPNQRSINGYPQVLIVWPGESVPYAPGVVIIQPNQPQFPPNPDVVLIWPGQSPIHGRPNVLLLMPQQSEIPGYQDVLLQWPGQNPPDDFGKVIIKYGDNRIPHTKATILLWPGQWLTPDEPYYVHIYPHQRQIPKFPNVVIVWPGDAPLSITKGFIVIHQGQQIPSHSAISLLWPGDKVYESNYKMRITIQFEDKQVPGYPHVIILWPGQPQPPQESGWIFVKAGQDAIEQHPEIILLWPPPPFITKPDYLTLLMIPPRARTVPAYPNIAIERADGYEPSKKYSTQLKVRPGDRTLPNQDNVIVLWLEYPPDILGKIPYPTPPPPQEPKKMDDVKEIVYLNPNDRYVPGHPNIIICRPEDMFVPGYPHIAIIRPNTPNANMNYTQENSIEEGDLQMPGYPDKYLIWLGSSDANSNPELELVNNVKLQVVVTVLQKKPPPFLVPNKFIIPGYVSGKKGTTMFVIPGMRNVSFQNDVDVQTTLNVIPDPDHPDITNDIDVQTLVNVTEQK